MKVAIIGFGSRGALYAQSFLKHNNVVISAVCDSDRERLELARKLCNLSDKGLFLSDKEFFSKGRLGDICVVATQDGQHLEHSLSALSAGYDLLLEKPIATSQKDCETIQKTAKEIGRKIFICHVLRYAPFFKTIKNELDSGIYGRIATLSLNEYVSYWHQAHSFVRGKWAVAENSNPMIIAKCCHDLDIISWLTASECKAVSSMGSLSHYKKENAPANSGERCLDCPCKDSCAYDAERFYIKERAEKGNLDWPVNVLCTEPTVEKLYEALRTGPYGRCVYKCGNNVVDHQIVNMEFAGGVTAHLTMTAFSKECYRSIHVNCEKGEIYGNMIENKLYCNVYGKSSKIIDIENISDSTAGHGGGDDMLVTDIIYAYSGKPSFGLTSIENSMQSHKIGFAAEKSRLCGGEKINL